MPRNTTLAGVRPHTRKVAEEILARWVIYYVWGQGPDGHHAAGRAIDFMVLTEDQRAIRTGVGNEIAAYVRKHHRRLGVQYIIWRRRIWNATFASDRNRVEHREWRWMEDRGNPTANHMDHPHVSLFNNPPPYRAPDGNTPPAGGVGLLERGDHNPRVRKLQEMLNEHGYNLKVDGIYGPKTEAAVRAYQRANGLTVDGIAGPVTLGHLQEDDLSVHDQNIVLVRPDGTKTNEKISLAEYVQRIYVEGIEDRTSAYEWRNDMLRRLDAKLETQSAVIDKLVDAVAGGTGQEIETLKREIREAIESVTATVTLDVAEQENQS